MNKAEFLEELKRRIQEYPVEETEKSMEYYAEMIDDRMEDGMSESEAVASLGAVEQIAEQIKCELPITTLVKQKTREKTKGKRMPAWDTDLTSGSCNLPQSYVNGEKQIWVSLTSGSAKFSFEGDADIK